MSIKQFSGSKGATSLGVSVLFCMASRDYEYNAASSSSSSSTSLWDQNKNAFGVDSFPRLVFLIGVGAQGKFSTVKGRLVIGKNVNTRAAY